MDSLTITPSFGAAWWRAQVREMRIQAYRQLCREMVRLVVQKCVVRIVLHDCLQRRVAQLQQQGD